MVMLEVYSNSISMMVFEKVRTNNKLFQQYTKLSLLGSAVVFCAVLLDFSRA